MQSPSRRNGLHSRSAQKASPVAPSHRAAGAPAGSVPSWAHDHKPRTSQRRSGAASGREPEVEVADSGSLPRHLTVARVAEALNSPARTTGAATFGSPEPVNAAGSVPAWAHDKRPRTTQRHSGATSQREPEVEVADSGSLPRLLTIAEVADGARVSTRTIRRLIANGRLPAVRIGRAIRVSEPEYVQFICAC
jgi:excisionase family DNA binding protein